MRWRDRRDRRSGSSDSRHLRETCCSCPGSALDSLLGVCSVSLTAADVMTSADVAELLKEPVKTVEAWARQRKIPGHKIG